jgi:SAM-dependent methyltransferase
MKIINKLKNIIFKLSPHLAIKMGIEFPLKSPNRIFLETSVFQYINQTYGGKHPRCNGLFIGTDKRSWHYPKVLDLELHTIDIEKKKALYGNHKHHIVGSATELQRYYDPESFDLIIGNGLIGFGMNALEQCEQLLAGAALLLKPDGLFVIGFNDGPEFVNFKVKAAANYQLFEEFIPGQFGLKESTYAFGDHTFVFLKKRTVTS